MIVRDDVVQIRAPGHWAHGRHGVVVGVERRWRVRLGDKQVTVKIVHNGGIENRVFRLRALRRVRNPLFDPLSGRALAAQGTGGRR